MQFEHADPLPLAVQTETNSAPHAQLLDWLGFPFQLPAFRILKHSFNSLKQGEDGCSVQSFLLPKTESSFQSLETEFSTTQLKPPSLPLKLSLY